MHVRYGDGVGDSPLFKHGFFAMPDTAMLRPHAFPTLPHSSFIIAFSRQKPHSPAEVG